MAQSGSRLRCLLRTFGLPSSLGSTHMLATFPPICFMALVAVKHPWLSLMVGANVFLPGFAGAFGKYLIGFSLQSKERTNQILVRSLNVLMFSYFLIPTWEDYTAPRDSQWFGISGPPHQDGVYHPVTPLFARKRLAWSAHLPDPASMLSGHLSLVVRSNPCQAPDRGSAVPRDLLPDARLQTWMAPLGNRALSSEDVSECGGNQPVGHLLGFGAPVPAFLDPSLLLASHRNLQALQAAPLEYHGGIPADHCPHYNQPCLHAAGKWGALGDGFGGGEGPGNFHHPSARCDLWKHDASGDLDLFVCWYLAILCWHLWGISPVQSHFFGGALNSTYKVMVTLYQEWQWKAGRQQRPSEEVEDDDWW